MMLMLEVAGGVVLGGIVLAVLYAVWGLANEMARISETAELEAIRNRPNIEWLEAYQRDERRQAARATPRIKGNAWAELQRRNDAR